MIKSQLIGDYNHTMGNVDRIDHELSYYETTQKQQKKFHMKVFWHLIDQSLFNAFIIYQKVTNNSKDTFWRFRMEVIEEIFEKYPHARR